MKAKTHENRYLETIFLAIMGFTIVSMGVMLMIMMQICGVN